MVHDTISELFRSLAGPPHFRVYGKGRAESDWHVIDIYTTRRRDMDSRWPLFRGTCITWTSSIIGVGCDFAEDLLREQRREPASREFPATVAGGRIREATARRFAPLTATEIMAHECGHTGQGRRMGFLYWLIGAMVTQCREGNHFWNRFENQASETGMFGGIVREACAPVQTYKVLTQMFTAKRSEVAFPSRSWFSRRSPRARR